jgi:hypothetical protein
MLLDRIRKNMTTWEPSSTQIVCRERKCMVACAARKTDPYVLNCSASIGAAKQWRDGTCRVGDAYAGFDRQGAEEGAELFNRCCSRETEHRRARRAPSCSALGAFICGLANKTRRRD